MGGEKDGKGCKTGLTGKISDGYVNMEGSQLKGNSVGLLSIWVLACVTIGGNLMGVVGMVIFIPPGFCVLQSFPVYCIQTAAGEA